MTPAFEIDTDALHAFADGQLSAEQHAAVEAYLSAHPDAAVTVATWQHQSDAIRTLFAPVANEAVPARLVPQNITNHMRADRQQSLRRIAAAVVLVVLGSGVGWFGRDYLIPAEAASDLLIEEAVTAHTLYVKENTHAVEVAADAPNLMRWLSNRIMTPIDAPSLADQGFKFVGGRLLPGYDDSVPTPAAQLMYENASAERVTLYITAALPDHKEVWHFESKNGVQAYYWANDVLTCTIVSDLPEADVRMLGKKIFEQLTRKADSSWNPAG